MALRSANEGGHAEGSRTHEKDEHEFKKFQEVSRSFQ
jgi:hypothetical protein